MCLSERLGMCDLLRDGLNDVVAELRADEAGGLAGVERHRGVRVGGIETAGRYHGQRTALILRARIVRVLLRKFCEVAAGLNLLEDVLSFGFSSSVRPGVGAPGHGDQNVAGLNLLRNLELIEVSVVVGLDFRLAGLGLAARKAGVVEGDEGDLA